MSVVISTGSTASVLINTRSALGATTSVSATAELLVVLGSGSAAPTLAVFWYEPGAAGVTSIAMVADVDGARVPRLQTRPVEMKHPPCEGTKDTSVVPMGMLSVMTTLVAGSGPRSEERRVGKECRSRWS